MTVLLIPFEAFAEVTIAGGGFVDRVEKVERFDDSLWGEIITVAGVAERGKLRIVDDLLSFAVDGYGMFEWFRIANGVGKANKNLVSMVFA